MTLLFAFIDVYWSPHDFHIR